MKLLLTAINTKYIHSNLAVYSLRAYASQYRDQIEIAEYTINQQQDDILADIFRKKPDVIAFSCYIWNIEYVRTLAAELKKVLPQVPVWTGGPEVSYDARTFLQEVPQVQGVMEGEGEETFRQVVAHYVDGTPKLSQIDGITYRGSNGHITGNPGRCQMDMSRIPFMYQDMEQFSHKIIYYETSRGCPFSCSYCLSSIDKKVRFRDLELIKKELQFFLDEQVPQVKFVDRTFNCNHSHAMEIWQYIKDHDNGITNFHFEIAGDLFREEEMELLSSFRPGLAQLEIGVQSTNPQTLQEIDRVMDFEKLKKIVRRIQAGKNIHQHLDLIAGLPYEDYTSFVKSFNQVFDLRPEQLQLGFLKVLKGSKMYHKAREYGLVYHEKPQYEVLYTKWISYEEILHLKEIEEMVEVYYNSHQFANTIEKFLEEFPHGFAMFEYLAGWYESHDLNGKSHSRMARFDILRDAVLSHSSREQSWYEDLLLKDLYLRENSKSRPAWARDLSSYREVLAGFYQSEVENPQYLGEYKGYSYRQIMNMTHGEVQGDGKILVFDYKKRNPLTGDAAVYEIGHISALK